MTLSGYCLNHVTVYSEQQVTMRIEVDQTANWHDMPLADVRLIASMTLNALSRSIKNPSAPWPHTVVITNGAPPPMVLPRPGDTANIRVALTGWYPIQFCYQFGHEWGHVLSNHWQFYKLRPFHWLEESICGSLSIVALKDAQTSWRKHNELRGLVDKIEKYIEEAGESESPLSVRDIPNWFSSNEKLLRSIYNLQEINRRLSLPLYERIRSSPILIRSLQARNRSPDIENTLDDHLRSWAEQCKAIGVSDRLPKELATLFGVQIC